MNESITKMKKFVSKMPKTINESLNFNEEEYEPMDDYEEEEEIPEEMPEKEDAGMDVMAFVDDIRKKSLKGMAQLADNPDDPLYDILKRIWQTCDKAYNDQKNASMGQNQQPTNRPVVGDVR